MDGGFGGDTENLRPSKWRSYLMQVKLKKWRGKWQPTPIFLPRGFHGQRSLEGFSPWGNREPDTTEWLSTHTSFRKNSGSEVFLRVQNLGDQITLSPVQFRCSVMSDSLWPHGLGVPVHHQLPELAQTHVHWVQHFLKWRFIIIKWHNN